MKLKTCLLFGYFFWISCQGLNAVEFQIKEHLGHTWTNELVSFPLSSEQMKKVAGEVGLTDARGESVPYQIVEIAGDMHIAFQVDLAPFSTNEYSFAGKVKHVSDLSIKEDRQNLKLGNGIIGISIRKELEKGEGPIEQIQLRSGKWTGGSTLVSDAKLVEYSAKVVESGPVFIKIKCFARFEDGGHWMSTFQVLSNEPTVIIEESFDAPGRGHFTVQLNDANFQPKDVFFRGGAGGMLAKIGSETIAVNPAYILEPWLHWWGSERQGNWFALYTDSNKNELDPTKGLSNSKSDRQKSLEDELTGTNQEAKPDPLPDMLMIGALNPSLWKDPDWKGKAKPASTTIEVKVVDGRIKVPLQLGGGQRKWMLGTPEKSKSLGGLVEKNRKLSPLPQQLLIKHGDFPLNEVKDYVLEWDGDHHNYPNLFIGKEEVARWKKETRLPDSQISKWERGYPLSGYNFGEAVQTYWSTGSEKLEKLILDTIEKMLHKESVGGFLTQDHRATLGVAPHQQANSLVPALYFADACFSIPKMTPEVRKKLLAQIAFISYAVAKEDYWSPRRGFSANPNMTTTVAQFQVTAACLIPSHPMAKTWAEKGMGTLRYQLNAWSDEDGGWLEAPHYAMVAYDHILGAFLMAARAGFGDYVYHERMKKVGEWFGKISTPRDHHTTNFRHYPPIGNTYHGEGTGMFGVLATIWKDRDPEFAANMQWICEEHGSPGIGIGGMFPGLIGYKNFLMQNEVKPRKPGWGSEWFKETGVVLRNQLAPERETYLHMIAGRNHEHYDYDSGSIVLWGKGSVLVDDWGYIGRHAPEYHSMMVSSKTNIGGVMQITDFSTQPDFDYVAGQKGAWKRQIAFVKDQDLNGPNYFMIRDTHDADEPSTWRLWLTTKPEEEPRSTPTLDKPKTYRSDLLDDLLGEEAKALPKTQEPSITFHKDRITVIGEKDVAFDLFIHQPERLQLKTEKETQRMTMSQRDGKQGANYLTQTALIGKLPEKGSIVTLIYPRLLNETSPKVTWHADGNIAEVKTSIGEDFVFLAQNGEAKSNGISFKGNAGAILLHDKHQILVTGSAGKVMRDKVTLESNQASSKRF